MKNGKIRKIIERSRKRDPFCFPPYESLKYFACKNNNYDFGLKWENLTVGNQLISTDGLVILRELNGIKCKNSICGLPMVRLRRGLGTFCFRKNYNKKDEALLIASGICHAVHMDVSQKDPIKIINVNKYLKHVIPLYSFSSVLSRKFKDNFKVR